LHRHCLEHQPCKRLGLHLALSGFPPISERRTGQCRPVRHRITVQRLNIDKRAGQRFLSRCRLYLRTHDGGLRRPLRQAVLLERGCHQVGKQVRRAGGAGNAQRRDGGDSRIAIGWCAAVIQGQQGDHLHAAAARLAARSRIPARRPPSYRPMISTNIFSRGRLTSCRQYARARLMSVQPPSQFPNSTSTGSHNGGARSTTALSNHDQGRHRPDAGQHRREHARAPPTTPSNRPWSTRSTTSRSERPRREKPPCLPDHGPVVWLLMFQLGADRAQPVDVLVTRPAVARAVYPAGSSLAHRRRQVAFQFLDSPDDDGARRAVSCSASRSSG
jgi:hypothetical protein